MTKEAPRRGRVKSSEYMTWAKTRKRPRFDLANSGVMDYPLKDLPATLADVELSGPSLDGYEPLQKALAAKCGVGAECVVAATGTSMANHLLMAALLEPGDEVLVEAPVYEPITAVARYLGAEVRTFARKFEDDFRVDPGEVERQLTPRTRLVALSNLHNPSSAYTDDDTLRQLGETAARVGARVLVDEVYLDALFERAPQTSFRLGPQFVVTSSLTKVYGLSGLRCGWVLCDAALAQKLWRLNDLFGVIPAHPAERLSVVALAHLDRIAARAKSLLDTNRRLLNSFLRTRRDLECVQRDFGTVAFPRLRAGDADRLCTLLHEKYDTAVVPGRFFQMPAHVRVGLGGDTDTLRAGLERLGAALDELNA